MTKKKSENTVSVNALNEKIEGVEKRQKAVGFRGAIVGGILIIYYWLITTVFSSWWESFNGVYQFVDAKCKYKFYSLYSYSLDGMGVALIITMIVVMIIILIVGIWLWKGVDEVYEID